MTRTFSRPMRFSSVARLSAASRTSPCVLGKGGNRRNTEQRFQFLKEARLLAAGKLERGGHGVVSPLGVERQQAVIFSDFAALANPSAQAGGSAGAGQDVS